MPKSKVENSNTGIWRKNTKQAGHEFGHFMGLDDRYTMTESKEVSIPDKGYNGNIMGSYGGKTEQKNIDNFMNNVITQRDNFVLSIPSFFNIPIYINVENRENK